MEKHKKPAPHHHSIFFHQQSSQEVQLEGNSVRLKRQQAHPQPTRQRLCGRNSIHSPGTEVSNVKGQMQVSSGAREISSHLPSGCLGHVGSSNRPSVLRGNEEQRIHPPATLTTLIRQASRNAIPDSQCLTPQ